MHLAGYPLATLLGVFGAAALGAVLLYILKLRRRPVPVVFSPIWRRVLGDRESSRLFSRLKRWLSLLLQLALLALLVLALGDPRLGAATSDARHVVVLIDASASMLATDVAPTRLDKAREAAAGFLTGLGSNDRMLIAQMDANVTPLSTMTDDVGALELGLERLRASDTRADLGRGLAFALDSLRGRSHPEIIVVSDGAFSESDTRHVPGLAGVQLSFVPVGSEAQNVAITAFSVRRYPLDRSRYEVMLEVFNTNDAPAEVELSLFGDGQLVQTGHLSLAPRERRAQFYPNLAGADRTLEAVIELPAGQDHLARDNRAYALMPERRRTRVLVVTPGNTYLEAALLLDEYLEVTTVAPPGAATPVLRDIAFALPAGSGLGIVGPSGSGKSTLARALVGAWAPQQGCVRLDGTVIGPWSAAHVGYLPQEVALFSGTVADNIARFDPRASEAAIAAAARAAGARGVGLQVGPASLQRSQPRRAQRHRIEEPWLCGPVRVRERRQGGDRRGA